MSTTRWVKIVDVLGLVGAILSGAFLLGWASFLFFFGRSYIRFDLIYYAILGCHALLFFWWFKKRGRLIHIQARVVITILFLASPFGYFYLGAVIGLLFEDK